MIYGEKNLADKLQVNLASSKQDGSIEGKLNVRFVGDIMLDRGVGEQIEHYGADYPWSIIDEELTKPHILVGNLECLLTARGNANSESASCFRANPKLANSLKRFSVLTLANNHIRDYGDVGIADTLAALSQAGIHCLGVGQTVEQALSPYIYRHANGMSIALMAATTMKNVIGSRGKWHVASVNDLLQAADLLHETRSRTNVLIALIHMGYEKVKYPSPEARRYARDLVDAGFDSVICHHPHVIQGYEIYEEKPILYSLGDFVFDGHEDFRRRSMITEMYLTSGEIRGFSLIPVYIDDTYRPTLPSERQTIDMINYIQSLSEVLANGSNDVLFMQEASTSFLASQRRDWQRSLRQGGLNGLWKKILRFRLIHIRLFWETIRNHFTRNRM